MRTIVNTVKRLMQPQVEHKNKTEYVLWLLRSGEPVTQYRLYSRHFEFGDPMPTRLSAIIFALRKRGINVKSRSVTKGKATFSEYYLEGK